MKKTGILLILTLLALTLQAQKTKRTTDKTRQPMEHIEKFNIETFNKNKKDENWVFTMLDGTEVRQFSFGAEYVEKRLKKDALFQEYREFYSNGTIKQEMLMFRNDGFIKGIIRYYDEQGKLTKTEDTDKPFDGRYPWEMLLQVFIYPHKIDLLDRITDIKRGNTKENGLYWYVVWDTKDGSKYPYRQVIISVKGGKIIEDRRITYNR